MITRITELRRQYGGKRPSCIPVEILQEMLETPYHHGDQEQSIRQGILRAKWRGVVISAVRAKCLDCCGWCQKEVELCEAVQCPLWPLRMGENPFRVKRQLTDDQRAASSAALAKIRMATTPTGSAPAFPSRD